jgi:hypothetical protein
VVIAIVVIAIVVSTIVVIATVVSTIVVIAAVVSTIVVSISVEADRAKAKANADEQRGEDLGKGVCFFHNNVIKGGSVSNL